MKSERSSKPRHLREGVGVAQKLVMRMFRGGLVPSRGGGRAVRA